MAILAQGCAGSDDALTKLAACLSGVEASLSTGAPVASMECDVGEAQTITALPGRTVSKAELTAIGLSEAEAAMLVAAQGDTERPRFCTLRGSLQEPDNPAQVAGGVLCAISRLSIVQPLAAKGRLVTVKINANADKSRTLVELGVRKER